jgi:hypothetical protein
MRPAAQKANRTNVKLYASGSEQPSPNEKASSHADVHKLNKTHSPDDLADDAIAAAIMRAAHAQRCPTSKEGKDYKEGFLQRLSHVAKYLPLWRRPPSRSAR